METNLFIRLPYKFSRTLSSKINKSIVILQLAFQEVCQVDRVSWTLLDFEEWEDHGHNFFVR